MMRRKQDHPRYHIGLVMEQAMGHVTHHRALMAHAARDPTVRATCMEVPYQADDAWQRTPGINSNLSVLLSLRARRAIRERQAAEGPFDALLFHTQVTALLSQGLMREVPCVLSLDATPLNRDPVPHAVPSPFMRRPNRNAPWEMTKRHLVRRAFVRAAALIAWSDWARNSLVNDYGIDPARIAVIPPGVDLDLWRPRSDNLQPHKPRLLFVGANFERKGGDLLLSAFRTTLAGRAELDIVTPDAAARADGIPGVRVHRDLAINSPALRSLFSASDIFVLPTLNDCTPLAALEAMASGLPIVATDVGAIREIVQDRVSGLLLRPADQRQLAEALRSLVDDAPRRQAMGHAGRDRAEKLYDAQRNYGRVFDLLKSCVAAWRENQHKQGVASTPPRRRDAAGDAEPELEAWASHQ